MPEPKAKVTRLRVKFSDGAVADYRKGDVTTNQTMADDDVARVLGARKLTEDFLNADPASQIRIACFVVSLLGNPQGEHHG